MRSLSVVGLMVLTGCASSKPFLLNLTPAQWEHEVQARGVDPHLVPNPLAVTDEMREQARSITGIGTALERLDRLQSALFRNADFPFQYENRGTFTAAEAYYRRQGNCLSFTNMFVALARSAGIPLTTGLVTKIRASEREGDLIVVNTHVVAVLNYAGGVAYYDFDIYRDRRPSSVRVLDDLWITALFLNNKGADELRRGHPEAARTLFDDAVRLAPEFAAAWGNLGVTRRRLGDVPGAFAAYERALSFEHDNPTVLTNVAALYGSLGKEKEAQLALLAGSVARSSPHVLIVRGDLELAQGNPKDALAYYNKARRLAPRLADAWLAKARAEIVLGRRSAAVKSLDHALAAAPDNEEVRSAVAALRESAKL